VKPPRSIFRLWWKGDGGYDSVDGFVVVAVDEAAARQAVVGQCGCECGGCLHRRHGEEDTASPCGWTLEAEAGCERIGLALGHVADGVVLRSFNAG
jgi:hypothetical protein